MTFLEKSKLKGETTDVTGSWGLGEEMTPGGHGGDGIVLYLDMGVVKRQYMFIKTHRTDTNKGGFYYR